MKYTTAIFLGLVAATVAVGVIVIAGFLAIHHHHIHHKAPVARVSKTPDAGLIAQGLISYANTAATWQHNKRRFVRAHCFTQESPTYLCFARMLHPNQCRVVLFKFVDGEVFDIIRAGQFPDKFCKRYNL